MSEISERSQKAIIIIVVLHCSHKAYNRPHRSCHKFVFTLPSGPSFFWNIIETGSLSVSTIKLRLGLCIIIMCTHITTTHQTLLDFSRFVHEFTPMVVCKTHAKVIWAVSRRWRYVRIPCSFKSHNAPKNFSLAFSFILALLYVYISIYTVSLKWLTITLPPTTILAQGLIWNYCCCFCLNKCNKQRLIRWISIFLVVLE